MSSSSSVLNDVNEGNTSATAGDDTLSETGIGLIVLAVLVAMFMCMAGCYVFCRACCKETTSWRCGFELEKLP